VDRATGRVVWNREISSLNGLSALDARLFVSHYLGSVYALDYASGKTFWRQGALKYRNLTGPVPMTNWVAVGDVEGYVHFLGREDGAFNARLRLTDSPILPRMVLINSDTLLAQSVEGGIFAFQIK